MKYYLPRGGSRSLCDIPGGKLQLHLEAIRALWWVSEVTHKVVNSLFLEILEQEPGVLLPEQ